MPEETYKLIFKLEDYFHYKKNKIRILGDKFKIRAENKAILIINNKKKELRNILNVQNIEERELKIKMILYTNIFDKSYMFENCEDLIDFSYFSYESIKEKKEKEEEEIEKIENENNEILIKNYLNEDNLIDNIDRTNPDYNTLYDNIDLNKMGQNNKETISKISLVNINSLNKTIKSINNQLLSFENKKILKVCFINVVL